MNMSEQPWTASGRALLQALKFRWRTHILAIEAEAARREAVLREALTELTAFCETRGAVRGGLGPQSRRDLDALLAMARAVLP